MAENSRNRSSMTEKSLSTATPDCSRKDLISQTSDARSVEEVPMTYLRLK